MKRLAGLLGLLLCLTGLCAARTISVYSECPSDPKVVYFTPEKFAIANDGKTDVSSGLQEAINYVKDEFNAGIVFVPSGNYLLSQTIYIPTSVRLIGVGPERPTFILKKNSEGFGTENLEDKGRAKYLFWFTSNRVTPESGVRDANAGTFYSAFSNIDVRIESGNPYAVAFRTHYAQHSFISHCRIDIGDGKAGIFDAGNELEDVEFAGGEYGIYTTRTSPSWQVTIVNSVFKNQRKACINTEEGGWVIIRNRFENSPVAVEVRKDRSDKIYMEDCVMESISSAGIILSHENYSPNQVSVRNTYLSRTPVAVSFRESGRKISSPSRYCKIENFTNGLHMNSMESDPEFKSEVSIKQLKDNSFSIINDIPGLPDMSKWKNVLDLGVKGDGETDDTEAIAKAVDNYDVLYFPQGWYKLTKTVKLKKNTVIIGLNPITTVLFAEDGTPAFSGFGGPAALIETPMGGSNIINGVGVSTGAYNYRAVGCKWQSGAGSYMNDVRFLGGHGNMTRNSNKRTPVVRKPEGVSTQENPVNYQGKDKAWDNQFWSLWITNGGGGTFKDIWTPDSYSTNGLYISDTETPSAMYEISVEHHVRNEVRIRNVKNWKFYALQLEEELREGPDVQPIEIENSENLLFANLYLFRVIWIDTPLPCAVRTWGCRDIEFYNVHNFTQMHQTTDVTIKDMNTGLEVLPWEFTRLTITGNEKKAQLVSGDVVRLATGFEYVHGLAQDSKGNIYFCEQRMRRIYRYSPADEKVTLVADYPWPVLSLAVDTEDNLLVCVKYTPQPGFVPKEAVKVYDDRKGTTFSWWGNDGFEPRFYSINPDDPESSFTIIPKKQVKDVSGCGRVCVPSHRWRDLNDFDEVVKASVDTVFVAPDGVTVIPDVYDLLRSSSLLAVSPGETAYVSDEYNHRVFSVVYETMERVEAQEFVNAGQFSATPGGDKVFVADGLIYVCNLKGEIIGKIRLPERPSSIIMGKDGYLYASAVSSLYRINITHS